MIKKLIKILVFVIIVFLAFFLRKEKYAEIPVAGQSVDEYSNAWVGLSLIEVGTPVGISGLKGYKVVIPKYINVDRIYQYVTTGDTLTLNYPWFDHPPLLGILTGSYAYLSGARVFEDCTALIIRRPIIIIGTFSVFLAMVYSWINFGFITSVFTGLIYGTAPLVVISSRMIQAENVLIPCILFCMISISMYFKSKKDYWLILLAISSGVATLFKLSGVVCYLMTFVCLFYYYKGFTKRFWNDMLFYLTISLPISFLYMIFGAIYDINVFKNVFFSNTNRFYGIGPSSLLTLIRDQRLTQFKYLPEVWIFISWIIFLVLCLKKKQRYEQYIPIFTIFSYLIIYIFFGSQPYGWYAFPFWSVLFILLSSFLIKSLKTGKYLIFSLIILFVIFGESISRFIGLGDFQKYSQLWRFGTSIFFLVLMFCLNQKKKNYLVFKIILLLMFLISVYINIRFLNRMTIDYWWQNVS